MQNFLRFAPLPQERVWGGRALETALGRALPPGGRPFGESWEIVDRPEAQSVVVGGPFAGLTLRELMEKHSAEIMGPRWPAGKPFPILVKWLDCRERLSLQVHPPAAVAASLGGEPKTENWFVAAAAPGAHLIVGLKPGVTRAQFEAAVAAGRAEDCVNRFPVATGDSVLVRSGLVHAIDGGNLILEIQQNSDTTYRVDDWGRVGLDGKPRQLHLAESLQSILWDEPTSPVVKSQPIPNAHGLKLPEQVANTSEFLIWRAAISAREKLCFRSQCQPQIVSIVKGRLTSEAGELVRGDNVMLPYAGKLVFNATEDAVVLITGFFAKPRTNPKPYLLAFFLSMVLTQGLIVLAAQNRSTLIGTLAAEWTVLCLCVASFFGGIFILWQDNSRGFVIISRKWEPFVRRSLLALAFSIAVGGFAALINWAWD